MPVRSMLLILVFILSISHSKVIAQVTDDSTFNQLIVTAINMGDAVGLAELFHKKIDMTLPGQSGIFSKQQAKFILSGFFIENSPESFVIVNENKSSDSNFVVGRLHTHHHHFRVCFLTKLIDNQIFIYQLRIE